MKYEKAMSLALGTAAEYRRLSDMGDVVLARQARTTIDELVATRRNGRWVLPRAVAEAMGRPELA